MKKLLAACLLCVPVLACSAEVSVSSRTPHGPLTLTAYDYTAGALCSLTWNGKQFIDAKDHGRCLQSAATFDGLGEQWNPTEAGSSYLNDADLPGASSSKLLNYAAGQDRLATAVQMAFWYPVNGKVLSNHIHRKYVRVMGNVVSYRVEFEVPADERHGSALFEVLCGYMPNAFSVFSTYDPDTRAFTNAGDGPSLQSLPVITSTPDHRHAIGVWSPDARVQYGFGRFPDVLKWTTLAQVPNPAGTYRFQVFLVVGTVQDVVNGLQEIYARPPTGY